MNNEKKKYIKLCSSTLSPLIGGSQRILINDDHILVAKRMGMREEYRRFFLKDICRITAYKTWWGLFSIIINSLILAFFTLGAVLAHLSDKTYPVFVVSTFIGIISLCFLLVDILRGPTGKVLITTLNSEDSLVFATRFHKTVKVLRKIRPMVEAAQGGDRNETIERLLNSGEKIGEETSEAI
ncbi:MAG: hypothetical protein GXP32_07520 [Kiritimatiellaeota bacterium]|nr:hypothetical protein [Kiritimatiellota bacterium]